MTLVVGSAGVSRGMLPRFNAIGSAGGSVSLLLCGWRGEHAYLTTVGAAAYIADPRTGSCEGVEGSVGHQLMLGPNSRRRLRALVPVPSVDKEWRPPKAKVREPSWISTRQVRERLGITYAVFINRTHHRAIYAVAQIRGAYFWLETQLVEIGLTDAEWGKQFGA